MKRRGSGIVARLAILGLLAYGCDAFSNHEAGASDGMGLRGGEAGGAGSGDGSGGDGPGGDGAGGGGGVGGEGGAGGVEAPFCEPGTVEACYTGPEGTEGVGICRAGQRECLPDGLGFSKCLGEQIPIATACGPDDCHDACILPVCGNGTVEPGEECDEGHATCTSDCRRVGVRQVAVGWSHSCALLWSGKVKCWGNNESGQLGLGDVRTRGANPWGMGANLPAIDLGTGRTAEAISTKGFHTCALLDDASVKCWGYNRGMLGIADDVHRGIEPGQMGDNLPSVDLGTGRTAKAIATSIRETCAILDDDSLRCWTGERPGAPKFYTVDLGSGKSAKAVQVGDEHTCAILNDDSVKCWGNNYAGQLGLEDTRIRSNFPGDMGDNLPAVALGTGRTAKSIAVGNDFTCAILDDDGLKCWGSNHVGQLGLGIMDISVGGEAGDMGDNLPAVELGTGRTAKAISANHTYACALLDDDSLKCWGKNEHGVLGFGGVLWYGMNPGDMGDNLPTVDLGLGRSAKGVAAGVGHTCAVLDDHGVKCWGRNDSGQLGYGDTLGRGSEPGQMGDALPYVELF